MTQAEERAWAAGLFEGEGTITSSSYPGGKRWHIAISMTDEEVLRRFARIVGMGSFYGPYTRGAKGGRTREHHAPFWRWVIQDRDGVFAFAEIYGAYLSTRRRERLEEALEQLHSVKPKVRRRPKSIRP